MLRRVLKRAGYRTYGWGLGRNMPVRADLMARLDERIGALQAREGGKVVDERRLQSVLGEVLLHRLAAAGAFGDDRVPGMLIFRRSL